MNSWIFFTIATTIVWALNNVLDEVGITKYVKNEFRYSFWYYLGRFPIFLLCILLWGVVMPSPQIVLLSIISGFITAIPFLFYYRSLQKSEAYSVSLVYVALHPLFAYILSSIFLANTLTFFEFFGFFILLGAGLLSILRFDKKVSFNRSLLWMIPASFMWAMGDVLWSYIIPFYQYPTQALSWIALGGSTVAVVYLLVPFLRNHATDTSVRVPMAGYAVFVVTLISVFVSYFFYLTAFTLGDVALTTALTSITPLFVFLIEVFLSRVIKWISPKEISLRTLMPKMLSLIGVVIGVYVISL